jgi:hypothetical protein
MKTFTAILTLTTLVACGQQPQATDAQALMNQPEAKAKVETQTIETTTVGQAGAPAVIQSAPVPMGETCPAGGQAFTTWTDVAQETDAQGKPVFTEGEDINRQVTVVCNGLVGQSGVDGQDGQNGAAGAAGTPGEGFPTFRVLDALGAEIGSLVWVNPANSDYFVASGDRRMQFSRVAGHFPNAYMFCSLPACAGTCKVGIVNGVWANMFEISDNGHIIQATGRAQPATFNYQSRRMGANCTNTSGSTTGLFDYTESPALGFQYPITAELLNTAE